MTAVLEAARASALLASCAPEVVADVVRRSRELDLAPGTLLFSEDDAPDEVWIVLEGDLLVTKVVDGDEITLDHLHPGAYLGEVSLLTSSRARHRARSKGAARLLGIPGDVFRTLLHRCDGVMATVVRTLAERMRRMEHLLQRRERMAGLGTLAAGLAHELNNPAAAARRASALLREQLDALEGLARRLAAQAWTPAEARLLERLSPSAAADGGAPPPLDALDRSDREEALGRWLESRGVEAGWTLAPGLVERGVDAEQLERLTDGCEPVVVGEALAWSERLAASRQLLEELTQSTTRIHELVGAVKAYSYVDTATIRVADLHQALDQSVTILGHKLREVKAVVVRDYDRALPPVATYGTELAQVWTNLLDNAADAVAAGGADAAGDARTIRIRTRRGGDDAVEVEIADGGPGIAPALRARIFDPFFTTKPAGSGTGLGLEIVKRIVYRHGGRIEVASEPGATRFVVRLPLRQAAPAGAGDANPSGADSA